MWLIGLDMSADLAEHLPTMNTVEFIEKLGDGTVVAAGLSKMLRQEVDRETVYHWKKRNTVPWFWRAHVARLASEKGVDLPPDFLGGLTIDAGKETAAAQ